MNIMQLIKTAQRVVIRAAFAAAVCLFALFLCPSSGWAVTTTGSGNWNSTTADAPWPGGTVPAAGVPVVIATGHTVTVTANVANSAQDLTINRGGALTVGFNLTVTRYFTESGVLNQTAGTISHTLGSDNAIFGQVLPAGATATYSMSGDAHYSGTKGVILGNSLNSTAVATWSLTDTASATVGTLSFGQANQAAGSRYLLLSGAATFTATTLSFNNTGTAVNNMNYISFASGSTATFTANNKVLADYQAYVTAGNIRIDGAVATWSKFQVTGTGGHILSLVPPPTKLAITVPPIGTVNSPFSVTVQAKDAGGTAQNVTSDTTVTLTQASGGGTLSGTTTGVIFNGTSSVTISGALYDTADTMTLTASATSGMTLTPITSSGITFATAYVPPTKLAYKTVPTTGTAGTEFSVTVEARDSGDTAQPVSSETTVTLTMASGGGTLSGTLTGIIPLGDTEVTISTLVYAKSDTMTLTATPTLGMTGLTPVTSGDIVFSPGVLDHFTISPAIPSPQTAGTPITGLTLTALDAYANTCDSGINAFIGTVGYSGTAGITGTSDAFTAGVLSGVSVTPTAAGSGKTFIVTGGGKTGTSTFDVVPGIASKLVFSVQPTSTDVGDPIAPAVTVLVKDANDNTVTGDSSSVTIASATTAFAPASVLTTNAVDGVATFSSLEPTTDGSHTLTASDGALTGATSSAFTVGADTVQDWFVNGTVSRTSNRTVTRYMNVGYWGGSPTWGVLNQTAGTITVPSQGIIIGQAASAPCAWNMSGSAALAAGTQVFIIGNAGGANGHSWSLTDNATATIGALSFNNSGGMLLLAGAATVSASNLTIAGANYISFASGCTANLTVSDKVQSDYETLVRDGFIRIDGVVQTDVSKFKVTGTGGHTLSLYIPPQGTVILFF